MTTQNKVTPEQIQALVDSLTFQFERVGDTTTTACWAFLPNGFSVAHGESACVDPANFDFELGKKYAKERCLQDARNKLWELEGYVLAKERMKLPMTFAEKMKKEIKTLHNATKAMIESGRATHLRQDILDRIKTAVSFIDSYHVSELSEDELSELTVQLNYVLEYAGLSHEKCKQAAFVSRMRSEFDELTDRIEKLSTFLTSDKAQDLDSQELQLMLAQQEAMVSYAEALSLRLKRHG